MCPRFSFSNHFNEKNDERYTIDIGTIGIKSIDVKKKSIINYSSIEKQNYIPLRNKAYYQLFEHKESWVTNYVNNQNASKNYVHRLCEHVFVAKDPEEDIIPFSGKDNSTPYRVDHYEQEIVEEIEVVDDEEDLTIYD